MITLEYVKKTREYIDYLERHILNVEKAWKTVQKKCSNLFFVYDDFYFNMLDNEVKHHDLSKLSDEEFLPYRRNFFPVTTEEKESNHDEFEKAWEHHKKNNPHHWENWTSKTETYPNELAIHCVHMVLDWIAMGYDFNDTAAHYYTKNQDKINLPDWGRVLVKEILRKVYLEG